MCILWFSRTEVFTWRVWPLSGVSLSLPLLTCVLFCPVTHDLYAIARLIIVIRICVYIALICIKRYHIPSKAGLFVYGRWYLLDTPMGD